MTRYRRHLPRRQQEFADYVRTYMEENNGKWPTYREIQDAHGWKSPNSVSQKIRALIKKGVLVKDRVGYRFTDDKPQEPGIPIKGVIEAGQLQEAVEADLGTVTLDMVFPELHRMFALRVSGQSMAGVDINSGDYVLLVDEDIPDGGIGAVLYNGETSLKRIYMDDNGLRLEPANPEYDNIIIEPDIFEEVTVLGRYIGHINKAGVHKASPPRTRQSNRPRLYRFRPR